MLLGILLFTAVVIGAIVGYIIAVWRLGYGSIGTLRIVHSDDEAQPYMFLELNEQVSAFESKKYVLMDVRKENYISQ